jgi:hypothetical protein
MRSKLLRCALPLLGLLLTSCQCAAPDAGLPAGSSCDDAQQCAGDLVCDPEASECAAVPCESDADCGRGAICAAGGACASNVAGGPCTLSEDCVAGETCRDESCALPGAAGSPCERADDCAAGLVCPLAGSVCSADVPCAAHDLCGPGAYCDDGTCAPGCGGLGCDQVSCVGGGTTSISGVVQIPAGNLPLPGAVVYVPTAPLAPMAQGASCERCDGELSGVPLVRTETNIKGEFTLPNMPVGQDIPVVVQVGKWRRQITIPAVAGCADSPVADTLTRLPRNRDEGDIPKIALTTGGADALECLLRKLGLDDSEFTLPSGAGRVNLFNGRNGTDRFANSLGGEPFTRARDWWNDLDNLAAYDIVLHSCEGRQDAGNKSTAARQALQDYADLGGRVFLSHWHNIWLEDGPAAFRSVASWDHQSRPPDPVTGYIDTSFDKGRALADWMYEVEGSSTPGELDIAAGRRTLEAVDASLAQRWIHIAPAGQESVQYFSFNTPVGAEETQQCGRVVFSDIHVSSGDNSSSNHPFPAGCTSDALTPQEKALVFMLFDLASCIVPDGELCVPATCAVDECGVRPNGCGGSLECGLCPGEGCTDRCSNPCGNEACLLLPGGAGGQCGPCASSDDCCPGSLCSLATGECVPIGG